MDAKTLSTLAVMLSGDQHVQPSTAVTGAPATITFDPDAFFEGAEKRLVVYFAAKKTDAEAPDGPPDLRAIPTATWQSMLSLIGCQILNTIVNGEVIAHLLSESSLFIFRDHIMIKTCGKISLLNCLDRVMEMALDEGLSPCKSVFDSVRDVFYSHKNMLVPSWQPSPHHDFKEERTFLDRAFGVKGRAVEFSTNPLVVVNPKTPTIADVTDDSDRFYLYSANLRGRADLGANTNEHFKFEIIMQELDQAVMSQFIFPDENSKPTAAELTKSSGIGGLIPGMAIDDYAFEWCGYSMNGIRGPNYMTIHITPEDAFSFVSLETDVPQENYPKFIRKVLQCFKPGKFMINVMAPKTPAGPFGACTETIYEQVAEARFSGFARVDMQLSHLDHLDVIYARYACADI